MAEGTPINDMALSPTGWWSWRCFICGLPFIGADSAALELAPLKLGHLSTSQSTSSGMRYSRLRLASIGWWMGGFLLRFAENDYWGS
jgi:hypothetical protein